jgi:CAF1 family ribonuclease
MDHIAKSGKPVVGHNCFLDLMFLTQSFVTDLQNNTLAEFKKIVLENLPAIYDTKYVTNALVPTMKETNLGMHLV